ncbi:MAG: hypothetical protein HUK08_06730 [Bacteroidaceae bacterium]|nr:hypothetical protein [Bacteroidaceae bacterium]
MAKQVINTGATALKFKQPSHIIATPFDGTETEGEAAKGDSYILETVVRDTTSVSQDDPETTTIDCETSDSPIDEVTKLGKYQFSSEVADMQKQLVIALMGWKASTDGKKIFAPSSYVEKYVQIDVVFKNGKTEQGADKYVAFTIPRLKLNSKVMLESMNSNLARINIAGTGFDWTVQNEKTPFYFDTEFTLPTAG